MDEGLDMPSDSKMPFASPNTGTDVGAPDVETADGAQGLVEDVADVSAARLAISADIARALSRANSASAWVVRACHTAS